jgi:hypothetical protein
MSRTHPSSIAVLLLLLGSSAARADYFVITATDASKEVAQTTAAEKGGWVLETSLYAALAPNKYSVVRGPFAKEADARHELELLQSSNRNAHAYVKDAGAIRIGALFGGSSTPAIAAALLGELQVTLTERPGGADGCEPQEPYVQVQLSVMSLLATEDRKVKGVHRNIDLGSVTVIKRAGEIRHMRLCLE